MCPEDFRVLIVGEAGCLSTYYLFLKFPWKWMHDLFMGTDSAGEGHTKCQKAEPWQVVSVLSAKPLWQRHTFATWLCVTIYFHWEVN